MWHRRRCDNAISSLGLLWLKPLSHQTAMPQRVYSVLKTCQRAVGSPRNTPKILNLPVIICTTFSQRPYSVHTTFPQRLYSVHDASTARKQLLQRVNGAHTVHPQRSHGAHIDLTAIIAFNFFYLFIILRNPFLQTKWLFLLFEAIRHRI